jgi:DNA-binding NarL/FixJ family response regulator
VPEEPRPRLLLADDHPEILRAFQRLLAPFYEVVGRVTDGVALVGEARRLQPDIVVVDLAMPGIGGLEACVRIKSVSPECKIVMVTATDDADIRQSALRNGASAFVLKQKAWSDLVNAIQNVLLDRNDAPS